MGGIYLEEHKEYQIDLRNAICSMGDLKEKLKIVGNVLSDVDWIAETEESFLLIEFKNWVKGHKLDGRDSKEKFYQSILRKYYGTAYYLLASGKKKTMDFVLIIESPEIDNVIKKRAEASIKKRLPFKLQEYPEITSTLIAEFKIWSVAEWNEQYPMFPLEKCQ